jgi:ABC-type transport system involved in cytochrome c biogenesis permease subunit
VFHGEAAQYAEQIRWLALVEDMAAALPDRSEFRNRVASWHAHATGLAAARGEASRIDLEVAYHDYDFFHRALLGFMACFLLAAALWFVPRSRWLGKVAGLGMLVPTGLVVAGIVVRCILRARPPVSTLYETILFITGVAVLVALFIEWINRRRLALSLGALLGAVGMFLAAKFEALEAQDTMPTLLAVLDTNFWLATHVTSVTIGYAACLLAGFIAHVYLLGKLFGVRRGDRAFYRSIGRMVYGVLGFGLVFATIGTILGGIWANDSWGRFWGWDPKENGALMIVLWTLLILHGRLAGLWRDFGICMLAVFGNIVVGFSWWGVNLMGVGLHSYGFTAGLKLAVYLFYGSQLLVLALGLAARSLERVRDDALERARAEVRGAIEGLPEQT